MEDGRPEDRSSSIPLLRYVLPQVVPPIVRVGEH